MNFEFEMLIFKSFFLLSIVYLFQKDEWGEGAWYSAQPKALTIFVPYLIEDERLRTWAPNSSHMKRPSLILITPMMSSSIKEGGPPAELAAAAEGPVPAESAP